MSPAQEAVKTYFKLKGKYDAKKNRLKRRILKGEGSLREKRIQFENLHIPCIQCKRDTGTIFWINGRNLQARCGDDDDPCELNILIKRGEYGYTPHLLRNIHHDIEVVKMDIIKEKLGLLFGLNNEETMVDTFDTLKQTYKDLNHYMNLIEKDMLKGQIVEIGGEADDDVAHTPRTRISKQELATINQIRLGNLIAQFKALITEFSRDDGEMSRDAKLHDAIELYLEEIIPVLNILRTALYDINAVIIEDRQYHLIQIKIKMENLMMQLKAPQIIRNIK